MYVNGSIKEVSGSPAPPPVAVFSPVVKADPCAVGGAK